MFRGNMPALANGSFAWDALTDRMAVVAKNESNVTFPSSFKMIDISMLVAVKSSEAKDLKREKAFFSANPDKGQPVAVPRNT